MTRLRPAALVAALVTLSALFWVVPAANAVSLPDSATTAKVPCVRPTTTRTTPKWHKLDEGQASPADVAALPARQTSRSFVSREVEPQLSGAVVIPTYVHVIRGRHKGGRNPISRQGVRRLIGILNNGMAGGQSPNSQPARYRFTLKHVDFHRNEGWYHAYFFGPRDKRMKRRLHRGGARTLNLYINRGGPRGQPVLGWSRFPWQYAAAPRLDSVSVSVAGLPGGSAIGYNLGDTVIHETGHWLGLLHTFQDGCEGSGDQVADTPAEAEPSFYCQTTRDTCTSPGLDPVHNFMDYSYDSCMNMFTVGQVRRMDAAYAKWRLHG
jgi:hypothetical protein